MNGIKKGFIAAGAVAGGVIGGAVGTVGKITKIEVVSELGDAIIDSAILTGSITGQIASGAFDIAVGKAKKQDEKKIRGKNDLKAGGKQIAGNFKENIVKTVKNSGVMLEGIKERDTEKIVSGAKTLGKMAAVGAITVGAVKVKDTCGENKKESD